MHPSDRRLVPIADLHRAADASPAFAVGAIEGAAQQGQLSLQVLMVTEQLLMLKVFRKKGLIDPPHRHTDHESIATLLSGRLRNVIDGEEFIAEPGATWRHPPGVVHSSEALEDCVQIEIKSPPRRTWG